MQVAQPTEEHHKATKAILTWLASQASGLIIEPEFDPDWIPEILAVSFFFHYITRIMSTFTHKAAFGWQQIPFWQKRHIYLPILGLRWQISREKTHPPGLAINQIPEEIASQAPPAAMDWARPHVNLHRAYSAWYHWMQAAEQRLRKRWGIHPDALEWVNQQIFNWSGKPMDDYLLYFSQLKPVIPLSTQRDVAMIRLALATAISPHSLESGDKNYCISEFRKHVSNSDEALFTSVAWAAFQAAMKMVRLYSP